MFNNIEECIEPNFDRRMSLLRKFTSEEILGDSHYQFEFDDDIPGTSRTVRSVN